MIIIRFMGGLGNQLFCYAFSSYIAQVFPGRSIVIDNKYGYISDQFSRSPLVKSLSFASNALFIDNIYLPFPKIFFGLIRMSEFLAKLPIFGPFVSKFIYYEHLNRRKFFSAASCSSLFCYFYGYWQKSYFLNTQPSYFFDNLMKDFNIYPNYNHSSLNANTCAIHLRSHSFSDDDLTCYYIKSIRFMIENHNVDHFYVFSDNESWSNDLLCLLYNEFHENLFTNVSTENAISDFSNLISFKRIIISRSSFSWWAARLSMHLHSDTIIIKPIELCFSTSLISPSNWTSL